ncbi:MAG: phosphoglucomutase/phosphomannomutase PgmG [Ferrovibrio sp.]
MHVFDPTILREYDIRGVVGETLTPADAYALGLALGTVARRNDGRTACVGRDGRLSSPVLQDELTRGLTECGLNVTQIGCGPTPMLYFAQKMLDADVAVAVTGSHNPPDHNGFKIVLHGRPFFGSQIQELAVIARDGRYASGQGRISDQSLLDAYIARLLADWDGGERALTIVWDAGNGAAGEAMQHLTRALPGRHILLYPDIDGRFPNHHPDPTDPETLHDLIAAVRTEKADLGIAFDGDGDRIGVVDDSGRILYGDQILQLLSEDLLLQQPGATIIADVKTSQSVFDSIAAMGGNPIMWKTGHSLIKTKMAETGAALAGEMSGHVFFADRYYGYDDALYAAIRMIGVVARLGEPLSHRMARLPKTFSTPELRLDCPDARKFSVIAAVRQRLIEAKVEINDIDGVRVKREEGWWLLRASNTQPALIARVEATNAPNLGRLFDEMAAHLLHCGIVVPEKMRP